MTRICALRWLITKIILRCTVSKTSYTTLQLQMLGCVVIGWWFMEFAEGRCCDLMYGGAMYWNWWGGTEENY